MKLRNLNLSYTRVADLTPIANLDQLAFDRHSGLKFDDTPATENDPVLLRISRTGNDRKCTAEVSDVSAYGTK